MSKKFTLLALAATLACTAVSLFADPAVSGGEASMESRIDALMAMPADQRRAELKKLSPDERRGLWFQVKRAEADKKNNARAPYRDLAGTHRSEKSARVPTKAPGTIQYDDGVASTTFGGGAIIGNRFDTNDGIAVNDPGTIDTVVAVVVQGPAFTTSSAGFVILGPQTGGGGAMALDSTFTNGVSGTTDTVTFAGLGVNYSSSFFVLFGDFASVYVPAFGTGTNNGQGHHGVVGYTGGMGPNITGTFDFGGSLNGLIRVTGNVLPVELMSFDVE